MFQTPSTIHKVQTLVDGGNKLEVITRELSPEEMTELFKLKGREGWFLFKENEITESEVKDLSEVKEFKTDKTPSQRLRSVLYVIWEKEKPTDDFDSFYKKKINEIIFWLKEKYLE